MKLLILSCLLAVTSARYFQFTNDGAQTTNEKGLLSGYLSEYFLPDFLKATTEQGRQDFYNICSDMNRVRSQMDIDLDNWATQYQVKPQWDQYKADIAAKKADLWQNLLNLANSMPAAVQQLQSIDNNKSITNQAASEQAQTVLSSLGDKAKSVFQSILKMVMPESYYKGENNSTENNGGFNQGNQGGFNGNNGGFNQGNNNGGFGSNGNTGVNNNNQGSFGQNNNGANNNQGTFGQNNNGANNGFGNGGFPTSNNNNNNGLQGGFNGGNQIAPGNGFQNANPQPNGQFAAQTGNTGRNTFPQ